jgi:hypothetical protein
MPARDRKAGTLGDPAWFRCTDLRCNNLNSTLQTAPTSRQFSDAEQQSRRSSQLPDCNDELILGL